MAILILLSLNCVNAVENQTDDALEIQQQDILADSSTGTFSDLQNFINENYGKNITLEKNYVFDSSVDEKYAPEGVKINRNISINGNNFTIDANGASRIFIITNSSVLLNNITFKNAVNNGIYITDTAHNVTINNSYFFNNSVTNSKGGAIYWDGVNGTLDNSVFIKNHLLCNIRTGSYNFDGGAIYWGGFNGTLTNSKFIENYAFRDPSSSANAYVEGAAVYWGGDNGTIDNTLFDKNNITAEGFNGEYEQVHSGSAGALYWNGRYAVLTNSNFTNNIASRHAGGAYMNNDSAVVKNCNFFNNSASMEAGALKIHRGDTLVENCNFTDNWLTGHEIDGEHSVTIGGAIYVSRGIKNVTIKDSYFRGNNATNGSALYLNTRSFLQINDTVFVYNQAKSRLLNISQDKRNFTSTFYANDNILNTIWDNNKIDNDKYVQIDGVVPKAGVEHSRNGELLYQDDREYNQNIIISILDENDNVLYTTNATTNLYGQVKFTTYNGKKLQFAHPNDVYYTEIINITDIPEILIIGEDKISYVNQEVKVPISLKDIFGDNITNGTVTVKFGEDVQTFDASSFDHEVTITAPGKVGVYDVNLTYTDPYGISITNSSKLSVYSIDLTINKTANVTKLGNNSLVNFTVIVNNTSVFNITDVIVIDELPNGLALEDASHVSSDNDWEEINLNNAKGVKWTIPSLNSKSVVRLWITARTNGVMGNLINRVNVTCSENRTQISNKTNVTVVPVKLNINKTANVTHIANILTDVEKFHKYHEVNYTIVVNNTGNVNATGVTVVDELPDGLSYINASYVSSEGVDITVKREGNCINWTISSLDNKTNIVLWVVARLIGDGTIVGNVTNTVTATSNENKTPVSNKTNITAVPVKLNINKTANVTRTSNNSLVNFTISVHNPTMVDVHHVSVTDILPNELILEELCEIYGVDGRKIVPLTVPHAVQWFSEYFTINKNSTVKLWITARVNGTGNVTNTVRVGCDENNTPLFNTTKISLVPINLTVNKTANVTAVGNNSLVNYTIVVNNSAIVNATDVVVIDEIPNGLVFDDAGYVSVDNAIIKWEKIKLDNGQAVQWNISKLVNNSAVNLWITVRTNDTYGNLTNNVSVTSRQNRTPVTDSTNITVVPVVIVVNKTADVTGPVGNNTEVTFTIKVNNTSKVNATNVTVVDMLPDGFVYVSQESSGAEFSLSDDNKTLTWILGNLTGSVELNVTVRTSGVLGNLTNNVTVTSHENNTPSLANETVEVVPVSFDVNKTADVICPVGNNTEVTFTIKVNNTSKIAATNVTVVDRLPDGMTFVSATSTDDISYSLSDDNKTITWTFDELSESVELIVTVRTSGVGNLTNNVTVTSHENDTPVGDNETVEVVPVTFTVNKTADGAVVGNNTLVKFTILVNNTGRVDATSVVIVDSLPEGLDYVDAEIPEGVEFDTEDNKILTFYIGQLNGTVELIVTARTSGIGNLTNNVTVTSHENDTPVGDNETVEVVPVTFTVNKTADVTYVANNTLVTFKISVNNTGRINATDVVIVDSLPDGLELVNVVHNINEGFSYSISKDKKTLTWTIPEFSQAVELLVTVKTTDLGNFTNNVSLTSKENKTSSEDNETIKVVPANLTVEKTANVTSVSIGSLVKFTIDVSNDGLINSSDIKITDLLDCDAFEVVEIGNKTYLDFNDKEKIIWTIPSLNVGDSTNVYIIVKVLSEGTYNNTAVVKSPQSSETKSTTNITGLKIPVHIVVDNITAYPGSEITIPVNVTTDDDVPFNGNIVVELPDGSNTTVEINNGTGIIHWTVPIDYSPDKYVDVIRFPGNDEYLPSNGTGIINVIPIPIHISVNNVTAKVGEDVTIQINVTADDDVPFNGNITVKLPDSTNKTVEIINGTGNVVWTLPDEYTPEYNVTAQFMGNNKYLPSNGTGIITVIPVPTHISVGNVTSYPGSEVTVPINVTADDNKAFSGNVTITFPDGSNQTVEIVNGTGKVTWHVPSDYTPDKYNDTVKFQGNGKYLPSEGVGTITVVKVPVDIIVGNVTAKPGDDVTIPIKVIPRDGSVFNGNVTVELPDGTRKVVEIIDGEGSVDWTVPEGYEGDYLVKVSFGGNDFYYPANGTGIVTVIVEPPAPDNHTSPAKEVKSPVKTGLTKYETGNPILALLMVVVLLGIGIKRKE